MMLVGFVLLMPLRFKNYVRVTPAFKQVRKRINKVSLWMRIFYAAYYPILLMGLIAGFLYLYSFGVVHPKTLSVTAINFFFLTLIIDWIVLEFATNSLVGLFTACGHRNLCCQRIAIFSDSLKGFRNASL